MAVSKKMAPKVPPAMIVLTDSTDNALSGKEFKADDHHLYIRMGNDPVEIEVLDSHTLTIRSREHRLALVPLVSNKIEIRLEKR
jgi:hypothetical protein